MSKCSICHKNEAVVFTTRYVDGEPRMEGMCLRCAYDSELPGIEQILEQSGITEENIDDVTARMNDVLAGMSHHSPQELLKSLLSGKFPGMEDQSDNDDMDEDDSDEEAAQDDDGKGGKTRRPSRRNEQPTIRPHASIGELLPANIGGQSEKIARSGDNERVTSKGRRKKRRLKFLEQYAINLTQEAREGRIDRIIGREEELARTIQILNRRTKNNPALVGEAGVGKSAIAEGLAVKLVNGEVPVKLMDQELYLLDMTAMVAGTQFRGQFEARMKGVVEDVKRAGNVILVIDELHNIMGAGDAEGAMNAANILKPALARGELRVIGSTTLDEYRRFIEKDSALERRFQKVLIEEPDDDLTLRILIGIKDYYEQHHHVVYPNHVLETAVRLSSRYITDHYQPDKAIDLIDEAGSQQNLDSPCLVLLRELELRHEELEDEREDNEKAIAECKSSEDSLKLYETQAQVRSELMRLEDRIEEVRAECRPVEITDQDIAAVVEMWTGIPVRQITASETDRLINLEERLHQRVIGQEEAVGALARAVRRSRAGFAKKDKPPSFLFVGPTGVGKTELVKALAEVLFDSEDHLIRLDMSEYMEAHTVSKLIGAPPGYVGYHEGGQLTEKIRRRPYSVVLFDEIEKAHADVYNMLLQILDDGRLTDGHGRVVSFKHAIIVMTSNAGTTLKAGTIGFGAHKREAMEERVDTVLRDIFRPEFLNRIDEIVIFHELTHDEIRDIVDLMLKEPASDLERRGIRLEVTNAARERLAELGYDPKFGARPLRRTIQRRIEDTLADLWLGDHLKSAIEVTIDVAQKGSEPREKTDHSMTDDSGEFCFSWAS
jgi:ATP-dependent Clp protease ATP-binding subunit ClpC